MAPKKALPPPPETEEEEETSEEESGESEGGEEGEESEEKSEAEEKEENQEKTTQIQPSQVNKKPSVQKQTTPPPPAPLSEEEEESESEEEGEGEEGEESDSPPSPNVSDFTVKPITPTKPASKDAEPTAKRSSDAPKDDGKDLRDRKKARINEGEEKKEKASGVSVSGGGAGRVWSEDDEISVLEGMIDYQNGRGADPSNDMAAFHEFIKGKLHADMSKSQLYEKIRRLKKKFLTNVEKAESGEDPVFSKPHQYKAFDLSKKIWGSGVHSNAGGVDNVNTKSNTGKVRKGGKIGSISGIVKEGERSGVAKIGSTSGILKDGEKNDVVMDDVRDDGDFQSRYPHLSQSFDLDGSSFFPEGVLSCLKGNLSLIDSVKARELDEKWKKLREQEAEFFLKRMNLMTEQTKLVLDVGKKR